MRKITISKCGARNNAIIERQEESLHNLIAEKKTEEKPKRTYTRKSVSVEDEKNSIVDTEENKIF